MSLHQVTVMEAAGWKQHQCLLGRSRRSQLQGASGGGGTRWQRQRAATAPQASLTRGLLPALAATAALGATAVTLRHVLAKREQQQQQQQQAGAEQRREREADVPLLELPRPLRGVQLPAWLPLASGEQRKEAALQRQLGEIEKRHRKETQRELSRFDQRLGLRTRTLGELRALAQEHKIAGRSRMKKRELVAALEAALGFEPLPPHPPAAL